MEKYIIQKTQKIVSALYLITDFIKDNDVIKWEIREEGISLISSALLFNTTFPMERENANKLLMSSSDKIISFLNIASVASLVSMMNSSILIEEIESLKNFINGENGKINLPGYILSDSFFGTDIEGKVDKGQNNTSKTLSGIKDNNSQINPILSRSEDKQKGRKESIINLLKKDSNLTIKDFTKVIKDCSEKTIQRELISLVKEGVIKKLGERRWSTYSLA